MVVLAFGKVRGIGSGILVPRIPSFGEVKPIAKTPIRKNATLSQFPLLFLRGDVSSGVFRQQIAVYGALVFLAWIGSAAQAQLNNSPAPVLSVRAFDNQSVRLAWPQTATNYLLEATDQLGSQLFWQPVTQPPVPSGEEFSVTFDAGGVARFFRLLQVSLTTITENSPADGETGVAVTRETVFRFTQPLATNTVFGPNHLYATFGGRRLLSRLEMSSDRRTVTLFYLETLPGSARVRVTFDAVGLEDVLGRLVDLDGDGQPGGAKVLDFDTLSTTPIAGTAIIGNVFASDPGVGTNSTNSVDRPLAGVTITVDGMEETLRTVTDANGFFCLMPCPAGEFFVHIDGRTLVNVAAGIRYPDLAYYPFVGKAWNAVAGRTNNLAGGTGLIYLPLISKGTLQPVSATVETLITFPAQTLQQHPELDGVSITVPANALLAENGTRGGRVGIAPVPADRLPGPLPAGVFLPLVITVQTDGPSNFDRPVPVMFPNLPDPETGVILPPGAKTALVSFNHDTGDWEIAGPMTISADGKFAVSDPGSGIRQPGWHGTSPLCGGGGGGSGGGGPGGGGPNSGGGSGGGGPGGDGTGPAPGDSNGGPGEGEGDFGDEGQPPGDDEGPGDDGPPPRGDGDPPPSCMVSKVVQKKNPLTGFFEVVNNSEPIYPVLGRQIVTITVTDTPNDTTGISIRGYELFETLLNKEESKKVFRFSFPLNISTNIVRKTVRLMRTVKSEDENIPPSSCLEDVFFDLQPNSGVHWTTHFAGSKITEGLTNNTATFPNNPNFRSNVERFIAALKKQNVAVNISSTFRTQKRAYLMYHSTRVRKAALNTRKPFEIPFPYDPNQEGVVDNCDGAPGCVGLLPINWLHLNREGLLDRTATAAAGAAMASKQGYDIAFPAGFPARRHGVRLAIDMTIQWTGSKTFVTGRPVQQPDGTTANTMTILARECPSYDEDGNIKSRTEFCNEELWRLGETYGVKKLEEDHPHWSVDGH